MGSGHKRKAGAMGVERLWHVLRTRAPAAIKPVPPDFLRGKRVAVDAPIHAVRLARRSYAEFHGRLLAAGCFPVHVFDGPRHACKVRRRDRRNAAPPERGAPNFISALRQLPQGSAMAFATHDAEAYCAYMALKNQVDVVMTDDTDSLAFGTPLTLFNYERPNACLVSMADVLQLLRLTDAQFVDFCSLSGTDFSATIPRLGPLGALRAVRCYGSLEMVCQRRDVEPSECGVFTARNVLMWPRERASGQTQMTEYFAPR